MSFQRRHIGAKPAETKPRVPTSRARRHVDVGSGAPASSDIPKLFINAEPGAILTGEMHEFCRTWPNQTEVTVKGSHFIHEDSPQEIAQSISEWLAELPPPIHGHPGG